jgi:uncharacterized protein involved in exopolysaccharide biosynthesis
MSITENTQNIEESSDELEINVADIIAFVKNNIRKILLAGVIGAILAALYSYTLPKEYKAQSQLLPEIQGGGGAAGGLSALAGLAGISMGSTTTEAVRPDLYPNIMQTIPFALDLMKDKVYIAELRKEMTIEDFLIQSNKSWFASVFDNNNKTEELKLDPKNTSKALQITKQQESLAKTLLARITTVFDRKSGVVTVSTEMPDPVVAAATANLSIDYLKKYVVDYRTGKARKQFEFLKDRVTESKQRLQSAEYTLAGFKDRNRYIEAKTAIVSEQRLTAEYMLAEGVYKGLVQQYEQAKVKIQEETPVFKVLQPAQIPLARSSPNRKIITLVGAVLGMVLCLGVVLGKQFLGQYF